MLRGRNHGFKRNVRSGIPYGFACKVYETLGKSKHIDAQLTDSNSGALSSFTYSTSCNDSCFVLPITELCSLNGCTSDFVLSYSRDIWFELTMTWNWTIRVIVFYRYITSHFLLSVSNSDGIKV